MGAKISFLIVDDDHVHRTMLKTLISGWGYEITEADDGDCAIEMVRKRPFDLILLDIRMVRISGLEALAEIKAINPAIPVIIMTAYSSVETAVEALKKGAYDYLTKPLDFEEMKIVIKRAMDHRQLKEENMLLKRNLNSQFDQLNIIGRSSSMIKLLETVAQVAPSDATVLIEGDSGSGKELVAGAIHFNSQRQEGPFIKVNCGALTETILESELFGHERGAFTGADKRHEGKFRQAHGGSLFLDEVSEMPLQMQVKLLRVLQEKEIVRVGGDTSVEVDVRIIAATNKNLHQLVQAGQFREDLFYRLNVVVIVVPSLAERREDIPLLAQHYLAFFADTHKRKIKGFTPQAMDRLLKHSWPGNVRELMNVIERAAVLGRTEYIEENDLFSFTEDRLDMMAPAGNSLPLEEAEKRTILDMLKITAGNKSEAARRLGITRRTLHLKLKKYGMMP
ncbi:MAG: sigma-54 dependent transcriptional regulator [Syntrophales bacterium]|nr:sigma-54 dependent transcriptional regulator [Syntrophales bacterium]